MRVTPRRLAVALAAVALVAGCSTGVGGGRAVAPPPFTTPSSPPAVTRPAGTVIPVPGTVMSLALDGRTGILAVATASPDRLLLLDARAPQAPPARTVALPGPPGQVSMAGDGGPVLVPSADQLLTVSLAPGGTADAGVVTGLPGTALASAAVAGDIVVSTARGVAVVRGGRVAATVTGLVNPTATVALAGPRAGRAAVLSGPPATVTLLDPSAAVSSAGRDGLGSSLDAGAASTRAAADRFGRVLITDTGDGELLAASDDPLMLRQRYPVPGGPYAIAYDPSRDRVWITLLERDELVGLDVAGGEPIERVRVPAVRRPGSVAVDPVTGTVFVGSQLPGPTGAGVAEQGAGGVQVVSP
jgi:hypothetical protein